MIHIVKYRLSIVVFAILCASIFVIAIAITFLGAQFSNTGLGWRDEAIARCLGPSPNVNDREKILDQQDFVWGLSVKQILQKEMEIYNSGKRLPSPAYYDEGLKQFVLPKQKVGEKDIVKISFDFINSVRNHIEESLQKKYSEAIIFSDMGHSHLYLPQDHWDEHYVPIIGKVSTSAIYEKMFADNKLKVLYHTAEQFKLKVDGKLVDDPWLRERYKNRNVLGSFETGYPLRILFAHDNQRYNTVGNIEGMNRWSAGFNISASKDGCFPYTVNGEKRYFDITLLSLPYYKPPLPSPEEVRAIKNQRENQQAE